MPFRIIPIGLIEERDYESKSIFFGEVLTGKNFIDRVNEMERLTAGDITYF